MKWEKKGQIIEANGQYDWMMSHIQNPYLIELEYSNRIFFTSRPKPQNGLYKANIGWIDVDKENYCDVIRIAEHPVFDYGKTGTFDEFGMMPGAIIRKEEELWMYYVGWSRGYSVPYSWSIGLAISKDDGLTFKRYGEGPILGKTYDDPFLQNGCSSIVFLNGKWHMFYSSGIGWLEGECNHMESQYILRKATSYDGITWQKENYLVPMKYEDESQTSPTVFRYKNSWHMFFPYRHSLDFRNASRGYRIGYAVSEDLEHWTRMDEKCGIDISKGDQWDGEMICYPHITSIKEKIVMLYCGNGFGKGGLGYAVLQEE